MNSDLTVTCGAAYILRSFPIDDNLRLVYVYVIGWSTVVFGINGTSNAVRKCKIARGEAEYYLLPDCSCIASAINPKYHSQYTILSQINPTS